MGTRLYLDTYYVRLRWSFVLGLFPPLPFFFWQWHKIFTKTSSIFFFPVSLKILSLKKKKKPSQALQYVQYINAYSFFCKSRNSWEKGKKKGQNNRTRGKTRREALFITEATLYQLSPTLWEKKRKKSCQMKHDTLHVTHDMQHMTCDTWWGLNIL